MGITARAFGTAPNGQEVQLYTLTNDKGLSAEISNFGGVIVSLHVPDRDGKLADISLGYDNLESYVRPGPYFGALIGRHGNRIENAEFELNGVVHKLAANNGRNNLHGGPGGFHAVVWEPEVIEKEGVGQVLQLTYVSKDGEEGFPGNLTVKVRYSLSKENELRIDYEAVTDKDTVVNLTNHCYFNLSGHASGDIQNHQMMIAADQFTPVNEEVVTTGEIRDVAGTPMDFRVPTAIGPGLHSNYEQIVKAGGYDHNWVLKVSGKELEKGAEVYDPASGRVMEMWTTKPGVQFYSGNFLDGSEIGKGGVAYGKWSGLCLETQLFPNAMVHKHFPSPVLKAGDVYRYVTSYRFGVK